jgi:dipeptidyl aminopeptidase/acylaminoacyl peptidase
MHDAFSHPIRLVPAIVLLAFSAVPALAQTATTPSAGLPPLIDRELFLGAPVIGNAQISPDGRFIAFLKPWNGTRNVWVKKSEDSYDAATLITADPRRPIRRYFWSRDSRYVLFEQDRDGDENFNVYAVNPAEPPPAGADVPPARNLTDVKGARAVIYAVPPNDPDVIYVGLNDRDRLWHDVYRVRISTGERTLIRRNTERISTSPTSGGASWVFDREGRLRLAVRIAADAGTEFLRVDEQGLVKVHSCSAFETCAPIAFHKDGKRVYMQSNRGDVDLIGLTLVDVTTGREEIVESDPQKRVDLEEAIVSERTGDLLATRYTDDVTRWYFENTELETDYQWVRKQLPGMEIGLASPTADERRWLVLATSDREPGITYLFDRDGKTLARQYRSWDKLPREVIAERKPIRYASSDGLEIPAYLTLPKGVPPKSLPLLVFVHGGPNERIMPGFGARAQFFANRGYAVLQPNFRGSTGYGKKFMNAGNRQMGLKMQDDLTWGVKHLVQQGVADPKRVGILGASFGGYAALAGVAFTPDLYAAAVSNVGISSWLTMIDSDPRAQYFPALVAVRVGDPATPEGRKQLERQSPLYSAAKIRAPLLVVQGANDPRVKKTESDQIVVALRDRGFPVEYIVAPDEGHGFVRPVNRMAMDAAIEKFLAKHLGGRYQPDMPPAVATRLAEITVDPRTVTLAKKVDVAAVGVPTVERQPEAASMTFTVTREMGGQSREFASSLTITQEAAGWVVTEVVKRPVGDTVEIVTLEPGTLIVKRRSVSQGPMKVDLAFEGTRITGSMEMGGGSTPVDIDGGGPLFADGASAQVALGLLPLAPGYTVTFRTLDVQRQKVTLREATVARVEEVTVPAGTFKAFRVQVKSAEGDPGEQTLWIAADTRRVVKVVSRPPNGATLTSELTK